MQATWLIAVSVAAQWLIWPAVLIVRAAQQLCRLSFQQLLHNQLRTQLYQRADRVLLPDEPVAADRPVACESVRSVVSFA